jgi:hypothetical protein
MTKAVIFDLDSCLAAADEVGVVRTGVCGHPRGQRWLRLARKVAYVFSEVAQTFLSAGFGDSPVPSVIEDTVLKSTVNPQTGMSALRTGGLNTYEVAFHRMLARRVRRSAL